MRFYYKLQFDKTDVEKSPSVQDLKTKIDEKYSLEYHQQIDLDSSLNKEEIIERINKHALKEERVKVEIHGVEKSYFGISDWLEALIIKFELVDISSTFDRRLLNGLEYITEHVKLVLIVEELGIETELPVTDFCNV